MIEIPDAERMTSETSARTTEPKPDSPEDSLLLIIAAQTGFGPRLDYCRSTGKSAIKPARRNPNKRPVLVTVSARDIACFFTDKECDHVGDFPWRTPARERCSRHHHFHRIGVGIFRAQHFGVD